MIAGCRKIKGEERRHGIYRAQQTAHTLIQTYTFFSLSLKNTLLSDREWVCMSILLSYTIAIAIHHLVGSISTAAVV